MKYLTLEWEGQPQRKHTDTYRAWMLTVQQHAAESLPGRILWVFKVNNVHEFYALEPGKPWQLVPGPPI